MPRYPTVDLRALAAEASVDLDEALDALRALYADVDERSARHTEGLDLPCHRGCSACCEDSVFLSPIEFFGIWDYAQTHLDDEARDAIVDRALALYHQHRDVIDAVGQPPPEGAQDHTGLVVALRYRCPYLDEKGACSVYPMREIWARLFGCSFNDARSSGGAGLYACHLVGAHLKDRTVTLLQARPNALRVRDLPLGGMQQLHPWYLHWLYGGLWTG